MSLLCINALPLAHQIVSALSVLFNSQLLKTVRRQTLLFKCKVDSALLAAMMGLLVTVLSYV